MDLPTDPAMLYSVVNMKLRDYYPSLDSLCQDMDVDRSELERRLADAGFKYDTTNNKFW